MKVNRESGDTYYGYFLYSLKRDKFLTNSVLPGKSGLYLCWEKLTGYAVWNLDLEIREERNERLMEFFQKTEGDNWIREDFACVFGVIEKDCRGNIIAVEYDYRRAFPFNEKDYTVRETIQ